MARKRLLTVEDAILLQLLEYARCSPEDSVPMELTQAGISRSLGVRRSHISISLDAALGRGTVEEHLSRVRGEKRRRKCYFLTVAGKDMARRIKESVSSTRIISKLPDGKNFEGPMDALIAKLDGHITLPRVALLVSEGVAKLPAMLNMEHCTESASQIPAVGHIIGREPELKKIEGVLTGDVSLLVLTGMPGIGKTALAAHAVNRHEQNNTFWYNVTEWSSPRNAVAHLAGFLAHRGFARLQRYLEAHEIPELADVQDILADVKFRVIMIFDDCQNASQSMLAFLKMLISASLKSPNIHLGLCGRRLPDVLGLQQILDRDRIIRISLEPLDMESSMALLLARGLPEHKARKIAQRGSGHPLYLSLAGAGDEAANAGAIEDVLAREIRTSLSENENNLLQQLSVFRAPVNSDALVETQLDIEALDSLKERGIASNLDGWSMHGLLREFYYSRQPPREREARHERAAEFYNLYSGGCDCQVEELYHLFMARDLDSAILGLATRGEGLLNRGYVDEILSLSAMVPDNWENTDELFSIRFLNASAQDLLGCWVEASEMYGECLSAARDLQDITKEAMILRRQGAILYRRGEHQEARKILEQALKMFSGDSSGLLAELHGSLGVVLWKLGHVSAARKSCETDLKISEAEKDMRGISRALNNLGILDWQAGDHTAALERYARALKCAEKISDNRLIAILYSNMGDVHRTMGNALDARRYYERCLELAEDLKFNWQVAEAYRGLADVMPEKRSDYLSRALNIFERLGAEEDAKTVREMIA
jgi:tetratricopeptide (TPR) repeat protein/DNA-binding MarR family transcriptional regulator